MTTENLTVPVVFLFVLGIIFLGEYFRHQRRELEHRERMAAMEKGVPVPFAEPVKVPAYQKYLLPGLIWLFTGLGLVTFLAALSATNGGNPPTGVSVLGMIPAGVGAAYLICYRIERKKE